MLQTLSCYATSFAIFLAAWIWIPRCAQNLVIVTLSLGSSGYLCFVLAQMLDQLLPRRNVSPRNKAVFITGCDTGFGHLLAKRLDSKGYRVFAGCLFPNGPDAKKLRESTSDKLTVIPLDVTSDESVQNALKTVEEQLHNDELWAVVNNAGILIRGEAEWMLMEDYRKQFEVNTYGVVRVTQAFLPLLRKFKGRLVTTTSFGGRYALSGQVSYCMSKFAACSFCDGLRMEMEKFDVKVISVEPFCFRTPMTDVQSVVDGIERVWSKAPAHVKESYGENYVEECKRAHADFYVFSTCETTSLVVDCLEEAVTAYSPHYIYRPGDLKSKMGFWYLVRLPPTIAHKLITTLITFDIYMSKYIRKRCQESRVKDKEM